MAKSVSASRSRERRRKRRSCERDYDSRYRYRRKDRKRSSSVERGSPGRYPRYERRRGTSSSCERSRERERRRIRAQAESIRRAGGFQKLADREGHEPVELFWDGFQWVAKTGSTHNLQTDAAVMNSTRKLRRLYFGNLPLHLGLTETTFQDIVFQEMCTRGFCSNPNENPVLYVWFAKDKGNYGFVEFASVEETEKALTMDGMNCMGVALKVSRLNDYSTASASQTQVMAKMGEQAAQMLAGSALVGGTAAGTSLNVPLGTGPSPPPPPGPPPGSTRFLRIHEIISPANLTGNDDFLDVLDDVKDGCGQHGQILSGFIVTPDNKGALPYNVCDVFLEFADATNLDSCMRNMHGRKYEGRPINMMRFEESNYEQLVRPFLGLKREDDDK